VDVAKSPPTNPPGHFKPVDYHARLNQLEQEFANSGNVVSKIFRLTQKFIYSFRDGHFRLDYISKKEYPNVFSGIFWITPFTWDAITVNGKGDTVSLSYEDYNVELIHSKTNTNCLGSASAAERELLALAFTLGVHSVSGFNSPLLIDTPLARVAGSNRLNFTNVLLEISK